MDKARLKQLYYLMAKIRMTEESIAEHYHEGKMRCPTHLSIGQEAVPAALGMVLRQDDYAMSTHRGHAHYLGKGGDLNRMIAEIYGKATGCSHGKGGSMHLIDVAKGFMGSTAIVGNSIPLGVGLALNIQLKKSDQISCIFLGDGAVEEGAFYESLNFAIVRKLPVLFVCENNFYSVYSHLRVRQPEGRSIHKMAEAIGAKVESGDGNDAISLVDQLSRIVGQVRAGGGPHFVELTTYRWREHCGPNYDNHIGYRTEEEFLEWKKLDPLVLFKNKLLHDHFLSESDFAEIEKNVSGEIQAAFKFAQESPFPEPAQAFKNLFGEA